jgi:hypothetical protein
MCGLDKIMEDVREKFPKCTTKNLPHEKKLVEISSGISKYFIIAREGIRPWTICHQLNTKEDI